MSTILISSDVLRHTRRLFGKPRQRRKTLPELHHILLSADPDGIRLTVTDLDHWIETRVCGDGYEPVCFLIPPDSTDAACRADRTSLVSFTSFGGKRSRENTREIEAAPSNLALAAA